VLRDDPECGRTTTHGNRTIEIGPVAPRAGDRQPPEGLGGRVPVGVIRPHRRQRHRRADVGQEGRVLSIRSVVRHLEYVGVQVHSAVEQRLLCRWFDVPAQ